MSKGFSKVERGNLRSSDRVRRTQAERSAATRELLIDATIDCIVDKGLAGASTPEICRRAGVSRGAQLHHFPTKADLLAAAVEHLFEKRHEEFRLAHGIRLESREDIAAAIESLWSIYTGPTLKAYQELVVAARTDEVLFENLADVNRRFFREAKKTLSILLGLEGTTGRELDGATRLALSVLDGLALNQTLEPDDSTARAVLDLLGEIAASGLARYMKPDSGGGSTATQPQRNHRGGLGPTRTPAPETSGEDQRG